MALILYIHEHGFYWRIFISLKAEHENLETKVPGKETRIFTM